MNKTHIRKSPSDHAVNHKYQVLIGNDGQEYISKPDKNKIFKWVIYNQYKPTAAEYYSQFSEAKPILHDTSFITDVLPALTRELKKMNINLFYIKWSKKIFKEDPSFELEYFESDNRSVLDSADHLYFSERGLYFSSTEKNGALHIYHSISPQNIDKLNNTLIKYFPKRTLGLMNKNESIKIFLSDQKKIKVEKPKKSLIFYVKFSDTNIDLDSINKLAKTLNTLIKPDGFINEYDAKIIPNWYVEAMIDESKYTIISKKISSIKKISKYPCKITLD